jgi:DNA-3-methyladenine glycosylase II
MAIPVARRVKDRIVERFGTSIERHGTIYRAFPSPQRLSRISDDALLDAGVQERRLRYLRSAIEAFTEVDESELRSAPTSEVEAWLRKINGIGEWSSQLILLRGLGRMDVFGTGDPLLAAAQAVYGPVNAQTMQMLASMYGEHAGYWLFYLKAVPALAPTFSGVA